MIVMKQLKRLGDALALFGLSTAIVAIAAIVVVILTEIALRLFSNTSLQITEEVVGYLVSMATLSAMGSAFRQGQMIRVAALQSILSRRLNRLLEGALLLLAFASILVLLRYVWRSLVQFADRGSVSNGLIPIPLWIPEATVVLGLGLLALILLITFVEKAMDR
jgi:TRAP-type C4-dicarboxylate transport system permease small subunit